MADKSARIRLGIFVIAGLALIALFFALVIGKQLTLKRDTYYLRFQNQSVFGLQAGAAVYYQGIPVGAVEKVGIDPRNVENVILTLGIDPGTPIKEDNEAVLVLVGITGTKAVEIRGGSNAARNLKPGSFIATGSTQIDEISGKAVSIVEKVDRIASNLDQLTAEENRANLAAILSETSALVSETRSKLSLTLNSLNQIALSTSGLTEGAEGNFSRIADNLTANLDSISSVAARNIDQIGSRTATSLDSLTLSTQRSLETLIASLSGQLDSIGGNLDKSIAEINTSTNLLLTDTRAQLVKLGASSDTLIVHTTRDIATASLKLNTALDRVNQILASAEFDALVANMNELAAKLNEANLAGLAEELTVTVNKAGNLITNIDRTLIRNRVNLNETLENLREASENLNDFARQISDQPALIWRGN
ncbi:MAG: MlaD family protein [Candidatus Cloacimonetes bacterium]|nr:MlaD family protein [Candidatus Cloacimonadota bacterium]